VTHPLSFLHLNGEDLRPLPLIERRRRLEQLVRRAKVPCLHLVEASDDGHALLEVAERHRLEGVVSKRRSAPYRSGECRDWRKVKTLAWREANRERWRLFERT
jgi:bifunctional non-homologous end joining protein LigD